MSFYTRRQSCIIDDFQSTYWMDPMSEKFTLVKWVPSYSAEVDIYYSDT